MNSLSLKRQASVSWIEQIWEQHASQIYNLCRLKCQNKDDADDLFQTVALKFLENAKKIENRESIFPWLFRVMLNSFCDEMRRRQKTMPFSHVFEPSEDYSAIESQACFVQQSEINADDICKMLKGLTEFEQTLIKMTFIGGMSLVELAPIFGLSVNALTKRRHCAIEKLKKKFLT